MRICLISEYFYPDSGGGTGTVLSNLTRHLKDAYGDVEIDVITSRHLYRAAPGAENSLSSHDNWDGINIERLNTPRPHAVNIKKRLLANLRFSWAALRAVIGRKRYDLVLVSTAPPTAPLAAKALLGMTKTPYAYIVYDLFPDVAVALGVLSRDSKPARILYKAQRGWLHGASKTVVLGRCMADHLVKTYHLPRQKIEVIAVGADAQQIEPRSHQTQFRERNNLKDFVVLWAGNFGHHQNFDAILDAAIALQESGRRVTFAFVGDGAKREYIADRIRDEGISNARMFPFVPVAQFSDMLASADVSLVALEPGAEGLGVPSKFYNILASGRPTVALVAPGSEVAHVLQENNCGVRVDQDGAQLARVIGELADDPARVACMGKNARRALEENYSMTQVAHQFYNVLKEVANGAPTKRRFTRAPSFQSAAEEENAISFEISNKSRA